MKLINTSVIEVQTMLVSETVRVGISVTRSAKVPLNESSITAAIAYGLRADNLLDSAEIRYVHNNLDRFVTLQIDVVWEILPTIWACELDRIFNEKDRMNGWDALKEDYGTSCYIRKSVSFFNSNSTKVILKISYPCDYKYGWGDLFV